MISNDLKLKDWLSLSFLIAILMVPITYGKDETSTRLIAYFMNGNNDSLNSRVYLWNPSDKDGEVSVRVFTLPIVGGTAQELTTTPLMLGTLKAKSALNLKLAEDILNQLPGITLPYTTDGGNLTLEFTITTDSVQGTAQVFSSSLPFGTYQLRKISSISSGSPSVLVANFMNGNSDVFNSRIYLWNPSDSDGEVSVRVFTLPLSGGTPDELTSTPIMLGTLGSESALNIKLAEDILVLLPIPLPYTADGGNLTVELTITAADVQGAAQVFSSDLAFGTYPLLKPEVVDCPPEFAFEDPNLASAVRDELGIDPLAPITICSLEKLNAAGEGITSLVGLESFTSLTELDLDSNLLEDKDPPDVPPEPDVLTPLGPNPVTDPPLPVSTQLTKLDLKDNMIRHLAVFGIEGAFPQLSELDLENNNISDISPLAELPALEKLELDRNLISDLAVFAIPGKFLQLSNLDLGKNNISVILPLAGLLGLEELDLDNNMIIDLTPLAELTGLEELDLEDNLIIDISPLVTNLGEGRSITIDLRNNPLNSTSCAMIPILIGLGAMVTHDCP
jgi:hypothetical protein